VDATAWGNRRGFGRFARNILTSLVELDRSTRYIFYADEGTAEALSLPVNVSIRGVRLAQPPARAMNGSGRSYYLVELPFLRLKERPLRAFLDRRGRRGGERQAALPTPPG
jgi:hypothetical protein